jgi:hypothetical protein
VGLSLLAVTELACGDVFGFRARRRMTIPQTDQTGDTTEY